MMSTNVVSRGFVFSFNIKALDSFGKNNSPIEGMVGEENLRYRFS